MSDPEDELIQELRALLQEGEEEALEIFLRLVRPEDVAEWFDELSVDERQRILDALDHDAAGTVLSDTTASIRSELVEDIEPERLARIAEALPADDAADLIGELETEETEEGPQHVSDEEIVGPQRQDPDYLAFQVHRALFDQRRLHMNCRLRGEAGFGKLVTQPIQLFS